MLNKSKKTLENFKHIPSDSLVDYYDKHNLNPVPLPLDNEGEWEEHIKKRHKEFQLEIIKYLKMRKVCPGVGF